VASNQSLDDAIAKNDASQQRMNSLERAFRLMQLGPRSEEVERAKGDLLQAEGQMEYAKSQLDATVIRAPVTGTILERTAEKGELVTAQFASGAEGGPRGSVVALADLNDIQVELDIAQDDFAKLSPRQEGIVTLDAFKDRSYKGEIAEMSPRSESPESHRPGQGSDSATRFLLAPGNERPCSSRRNEVADRQRAPVRNRLMFSCPPPPCATKMGRSSCCSPSTAKLSAAMFMLQGQRSGGYLVDSLVGGESVITAGPADLQDGQKIRIKGQS
jgi:HlyD family secretion protein